MATTQFSRLNLTKFNLMKFFLIKKNINVKSSEVEIEL